MAPLFVGSIILSLISAGLFPPVVTTLIVAILAFINIVVWIVTAPAEEDLYPGLYDKVITAFEAEDGA